MQVRVQFKSAKGGVVPGVVACDLNLNFQNLTGIGYASRVGRRSYQSELGWGTWRESTASNSNSNSNSIVIAIVIEIVIARVMVIVILIAIVIVIVIVIVMATARSGCSSSPSRASSWWSPTRSGNRPCRWALTDGRGTPDPNPIHLVNWCL